MREREGEIVRGRIDVLIRIYIQHYKCVCFSSTGTSDPTSQLITVDQID